MEQTVFIKTFIRFLKCHHCYSSFKNNIQASKGRHFAYLTAKYSPSLWLMVSFTWAYTKQGATYWKNIDKQWQIMCKIK